MPFVVRFPAAGFLPFVGARPFVLAPLVLAAPLAGGSVALAAAVPSVAVDVFFDRLRRGGFSLVSLSFESSRSRAHATTGVTMPVRNITSCVPIRIADDTTM